MDPMTVELIIALAPVALKLMELAGPEIIAVLQKLGTKIEDPTHYKALSDAFDVSIAKLAVMKARVHPPGS